MPYEWIIHVLNGNGVRAAEHIATGVTVVLMVAIAFASLAMVHRWIVPLLDRLVRRTSAKWNHVCRDRGLFYRAGWMAPALLIHALTVLWLTGRSPVAGFLVLVSQLWLWLSGLLVLHAALDASLDIYARFPVSKQVPIRGFVQAVKLASSLLVIIVALALLMGQSPALLISGMGAMAAVLMLIFKDPILGLVAGIQLSANRMLAVGDWLEMPKYNADGDVIDITLTTVKVCNWDRTITTIPTYALIADSFKNWRGMTESGGRRIARSVFIDMSSIHFLDEEGIERLRRLHLLADYMDRKIADIENDNREKGILPGSPANGRHLTNIGTFRAYLVAYLRQHPRIRQDMILIVRQRDPTPQGLPLQLYAFVDDTRWVEYEGVQSDLFDHVLAVAPEFGLRVYQSPSSADLREWTGRMTGESGPRSGVLTSGNIRV